MNRSCIAASTLAALALCAVALPSCSAKDDATEPSEPEVGLAPRAAWPKFRGDAAQTGRGHFAPTSTAGRFWEVKTAKGIFSSPVISEDGTTFVGSADRTFYAIDRDGNVRWKLLTGEIIDSSALLDDRGRVYFGSGDGKLRALDAATGTPVWTMEADDPAVNKSFIRWFEGNVAIGPSGTLYVPNDNFFLYAIDRDTGAVRWRFKTPDQTWSLPAVDAKTENIYVGNNNVVPLLGANTFALAKDGTAAWTGSSLGSIAASPMIAGDRVVVGGFDGYVRAFTKDSGDLLWEVPTRDHVYASAALMPDGTIVQASTDGTVYALDPASGAIRWTFDTPDPIRSSPAIDTDGNIYFGGGDGRLWVLNRDGSLRWSMRLVDDVRNDLNASPALGPDGIVIASESGQIFGIPYDFCLRAPGTTDPRCTTAMPPHAATGAALRFVTAMGATLEETPDTIDANEPLTFELSVSEGGRTKLATLDASSVVVETTPPTKLTTMIAGDGKFLTVVPTSAFPDDVEVRIRGRFLVDHERHGLRLTGGTPGGDVAKTVHLKTRARGATTTNAGATWELARLALPMPAILPSYNQIGFDSLHYLVGMVEDGGQENGHGVAWMIGAHLADGENKTVVDPTTRALFPLEVLRDGDRVTFSSKDTLRVEVMNVIVPFSSFRIATRLDGGGAALGLAHMSGSTVCGRVPFYGLFLQTLGLCNAQTDELTVVGGAELRKTTIAVAPTTEVDDVAMTRTATSLRATLTGSRIHGADHVVGLLLVDADTGAPVVLDYGVDTTRTLDGAGNVTALEVPFGSRTIPQHVRAHIMVDTRRVATKTLP